MAPRNKSGSYRPAQKACILFRYKSKRSANLYQEREVGSAFYALPQNYHGGNCKSLMLRLDARSLKFNRPDPQY